MAPIWIVPLMLCASASAQTLLDYTAAATGGSVGTVAGKKISDGLDKALGRAAGQASKAAAQGQPAAAPAAAKPAVEAQKAESPKAATRKKRTSPVLVTRFVGPTLPPEPAAEPQPAPAPPPPPPAPTNDTISALKPGATRDEVLALLGKPAARITMADEGRLVETYHFRSREGSLARVRLTDGSVTSVEPQ